MPDSRPGLPSSVDAGPRGRNAIVYNASPFDTRGSANAVMLSFLRLLKQRYESVLRHLPEEEALRRRELRAVLQSLTFAEAFLEKGELNRAHPEHPPQVAVLGPTQAGKSSVLNWLLGTTLATVSPLAGFTVHPQGFALDLNVAGLRWLDDYLRQFQRTPRDQLDHERYDAYALESASAGDAAHPLRGALVWDTPDFDSIDAEDYRLAVLRVAALTDVVVLILSKDKYADLSVWEMMKLLAPLGQPTVVVLNKVDPASGHGLVESLKEKWRATRSDPPPPIVPLPYLDSPNGLAGLESERRQLLGEVDRARRAVQRERHGQRARALVEAHWSIWVGPVKAEHRLHLEWRELVDEALRESLALYRRDYLNHPHHYATFQRALAELLTLLEVPGIGGALLAARKIVTWPVRQLQKLGRKGEAGADVAETSILHQAADHAFIRIGETLLLRRDDDLTEQSWWRELGGLLRADKPALLDRFSHRSDEYQAAFRPEIEKTAHGLYEHLQGHPAILNSLRATRVTTDAAALALALHTGGIGVQDFVIAPAILSLTTMLAEGALGRYMEKASNELKQRQLAAVEALFRQSLELPLLRLTERLDSARRFDISPETLQAAEAHRV
jgi:GTP-binding protein EngB required for normal cell division